jgi:DNA-binding IclR family transcriptional regulator
MPSPSPPPTIERLLGEPIGSTGTLELLLLLRSAREPLRVDDLSEAIGSPASWTDLQLGALARGRLVAPAGDGGWAYAPASPRLAGAVDELARAWQRDRRSVIRWLLQPRRRGPGAGR